MCAPRRPSETRALRCCPDAGLGRPCSAVIALMGGDDIDRNVGEGASRRPPRARMRCVLFGTAVALMLVGCASPPSQPSGCIAYSPAVPFVASLGRVCATQLDNRWAVSVKHAGYALVETDV